MKVSLEKARRIGERLGLNWKKINLIQFALGMREEFEHGKKDPQTNVTNDNWITTAKIALAHLKEDPKYYTKLKLAMSESLSVYKIYKDLLNLK